MSGTTRWRTGLVLAALLPWGTAAWAADVGGRGGTAVDASSSNEAEEEPLLVIPRTSPPVVPQRKNQARAAAREASVASESLAIGSAHTTTRKAGKPAAHTIVPRDRDPNLITVAAEDEAVPTQRQKESNRHDQQEAKPLAQ